MSSFIKETLDSKTNIVITKPLAQAIINLVNRYETRDDHPSALNSPYLGIHKIYFKDGDRSALFELFDSNEREVSKLISSNIKGNDKIFGISMRSFIPDFIRDLRSGKLISGITSTELKKVIYDISSIDNNFKVASDPFNLFTSYIIHKVLIADIPDNIKHEAVFKLIMYLQYRFFTSLVNYRFKYVPNEDVMVAMYEGLSNRYDIKVFGTWKKLMEERARLFTSKEESVHYESLKKYDEDKKIIYFISDTQTRIRNQINAIYEEFRKTKELNDTIGTYSTTGIDNDDEKVVLDVQGGFDIVITNVYNDTLSVTRLLDDRNIKICAGIFKNINTTTFRSALIRFSEESVKQAKSGQSDLIKVINGTEIIVGTHALIEQIIQASYRYCFLNDTNIKIPMEVIKTVKDAFSSSRVLNEDINRINQSVHKIVVDMNITQRLASIASYRLGFIMYFVLMSFRYR